ncbi:protein translocase subunit SecA 1 [Roseburia sp. CAG:100]|nr:protein translocase subunit SecA 1 [Roseburia sp. CAG:100]
MKQTNKIRKLQRILNRIKKYKSKIAAMTDEQLADMTRVFRERLAQGVSLDELLPEAYAVICEADYRILGKFPYDVQILGGIALHQGYLAEMNTGEGKTLTATMPLYLNALTGKSTILVTTNEYLVLRDAEEMGQVYSFMGLTVAAGVRARQDEKISNDEKREIYDADIVYTTHSALGFDYLFNNLVTSAEDRFMREFYYVIIDEADFVLLDSAQTPLVISGAPRVQSNLYEMADFFVKTLEEDRDYEVEEKKVWLTDQGVRYAEQYFGIDNFYGREYFEINRHVTLALRAHVLFAKEKEYVVAENEEIRLLDSGSGRMMPGVKLRGGQHQALEVKEHLKVSQENRSVASVTYQNLFLLFPKMAGMSGTIADASDELRDVYGVNVLVVPPNCPVIRKDLPDRVFQDADSQFRAAIDAACEVHSTGQPVLLVVSTIAETELVSRLLTNQKIPHNVLNANNAFWEADIIKEAGQMNAVTVATAMAGRGTDIKLGEGVEELGGLAIIGVGRMNNIRQERQARGRAGRQGAPGNSRFYISLEDEIVTDYGAPYIRKYMEKGRHFSKGRIHRLICNAQKLCEESAVLSRRQALNYDEVMQKQRQLIYSMRDELLDGGRIGKERLMQIAENNIQTFVGGFSGKQPVSRQAVSRYLLDNISYQMDDISDSILQGKESVTQYLRKQVEAALQEQESRIGDDETMEEFVRVATLRALDDAWVEEVDYLQQLQSAVAGRTSAQRNPVFEYRKDALESFGQMEQTVVRNVMRNILLSEVSYDAEGRMQILFP